MAGVNVSREALAGVKTSLNRFKTEIADVPSSMARNVGTVRSECENAIREVEIQISRLEQQISSKRMQLQRLQQDLTNARSKLRETEYAEWNTEKALAGIEYERKKCEQELPRLRNQLSSCDETQQIQCRQAVGSAERRLSELIDHEHEAAAELRAQREMISKLNREITKIGNNIGYTNSELTSLEAERSRKEFKRDRMGRAFDSLRAELDSFINSVRRFTECALTQAQQDITSVDQCIQYIDDYLATNL